MGAPSSAHVEGYRKAKLLYDDISLRVFMHADFPDIKDVYIPVRDMEFAIGLPGGKRAIELLTAADMQGRVPLRFPDTSGKTLQSVPIPCVVRALSRRIASYA